MTDASFVDAQYGNENLLDTRRSVWRDSEDGRNPTDLAALAIRREQPATVLEVGCGGGQFAARVADENPQARVLATDRSTRFVEIAAARGVPARMADISDLPFDDGTFDVPFVWNRETGIVRN